VVYTCRFVYCHQVYVLVQMMYFEKSTSVPGTRYLVLGTEYRYYQYITWYWYNLIRQYKYGYQVQVLFCLWIVATM
jgi:hypothetical protein